MVCSVTHEAIDITVLSMSKDLYQHLWYEFKFARQSQFRVAAHNSYLCVSLGRLISNSMSVELFPDTTIGHRGFFIHC